MAESLPPPPSVADLHKIGPEVHVLPRGAVVWRVYFRGGPHPTTWDGFRSYGPTGSRFDGQIVRRGGRRVVHDLANDQRPHPRPAIGRAEGVADHRVGIAGCVGPAAERFGVGRAAELDVVAACEVELASQLLPVEPPRHVHVHARCAVVVVFDAFRGRI